MSQVNVDGVGIEYQVTGHGRPVVLLHGWPDSGRLWRYQVPALTDAGFQVIVPDLRGYGRSGKPEAVEAYSLPVLAGDVLAILADQEVDRAHVVGHDWGAALGWVLASFAPRAVTFRDRAWQLGETAVERIVERAARVTWAIRCSQSTRSARLRS